MLICVFENRHRHRQKEDNLKQSRDEQVNMEVEEDTEQKRRKAHKILVCSECTVCAADVNGIIKKIISSQTLSALTVIYLTSYVKCVCVYECG